MTDENDDDDEHEYEPAGPERDPGEWDITKDGFGRFSYKEEDLLDENGEGDAEATAAAQRVLERRRELSPEQRRAEFRERMRAQKEQILIRRQRKKDEYPGVPYSESNTVKADEVPVVNMKASADWIAEGRDETKDTDD